MDLRDALTQISEIRRQVARTEVYRGYRAMPVAISGLLAGATAACQAAAIPDPAQHLDRYLILWIGAALLSMAMTGGFMFVHYWYSSAISRQTTLLALGQFVPCIAAGGVLAFVFWHHARDYVWMLPGLWAMLFSLGIFASFRLLPRATFWVAVYYLMASAFCLAWGQGEWAYSPWAMGLTFGIGQLLAAAVLYWTLERQHGEEQENL